jgi:hypothetical protein
MADVVACPHCGSVLGELQMHIAGMERDLAAKRRRIAALEGEVKRKLREDPMFPQAMEVLERWRKELAPRTRELNGQRLTHCLARLHGGYTKDELIISVLGYRNKPYVTSSGRSAHGRDSERHVDAELIFRDAKHVDQGMAMAAQSEDIEQQIRTERMTPVARLQLRLGL